MIITTNTWPEVSSAAKDLLRKGAELAQSLPANWLEKLDASLSFTNDDAELLEDPVLLEASRRANRAGLLHWANANLRQPGEPVEPFVSADMIETTRELTRRGVPELLMNSARSTQNASWEIWIRTLFSLTSDAQLLQELVHVSLRSINHFFDGNMRELTRVVQEERALMEQNNHVDKRYFVSRMLDGRETDTQLAKRQLNFDVGFQHQAGIIWSLAPDSHLEQLEEMANALARQKKLQPPLIVLAGPATLWVWFQATSNLTPMGLAELAQHYPGVYVALGSSAKGLNGFRRSHLEALNTQRVMSSLAGAASIVSIDQVRMVSLMTQDKRAARRFVIASLGRLSSESALLQRSLYAFLAEGCNLTRAAEVLGMHRNTLLRHIERAESLLPLKLDEHRIQIGAALQLLLWSKPVEEEER